MAYKKYIKKNGKIYGPYIYHSRRVNGKVISEYRGTKTRNLNYLTYFVGILIISILILTFVYFKPLSVGRVILGFEDLRLSGNLSSGEIYLDLKEGELLPSEVELILENEGEIYTYLITDLTELKKFNGNYFLENNPLKGYGEGVGFIGKKETPLLISLEYEFLETSSGSNGEEIPLIEEEENEIIEEVSQEENEIIEEISLEEIQTEIIEEEHNEETISESSSEEISEEDSLEVEEIEEESSPSITGQIIGRIFPLTGKVTEEESKKIELKKGDSVSLQIPEGKKLNLIKATYNQEEISLSNFNIDYLGDEAIITTDYSLIEEGFGEEFLGQTYRVSISIPNLKSGNVNVKMVYQDKILFEINSEFEENLEEETFEELNETKIEFSENETLEEEFEIKNLSLKSYTLSQEELDFLNFLFPGEEVSITYYSYRDKISVEYIFKDYTYMAHYSSNLNQEVLQELIERDKNLFLKDILNEIKNEKPERKIYSNLS